MNNFAEELDLSWAEPSLEAPEEIKMEQDVPNIVKEFRAMD